MPAAVAERPALRELKPYAWICFAISFWVSAMTKTKVVVMTIGKEKGKHFCEKQILTSKFSLWRLQNSRKLKSTSSKLFCQLFNQVMLKSKTSKKWEDSWSFVHFQFQAFSSYSFYHRRTLNSPESSHQCSSHKSVQWSPQYSRTRMSSLHRCTDQNFDTDSADNHRYSPHNVNRRIRPGMNIENFEGGGTKTERKSQSGMVTQLKTYKWKSSNQVPWDWERDKKCLVCEEVLW